ncbi:hypothetical protein EVAR_50564_1 [Eumeta japonica]|uniref:Uncharacterized protein n=1 Tax=Eumeta variegata TaxID=151549 RepID=A0A4C1ZCX3_EUMVA|nr:hypothetical protein EVAR_50564_1 [Eumeta japonica]
MRHSLLRTQESLEFRDQRLGNDRIQHAISRSLESVDSREQCLEDDRIRHAISEQKIENDRHHHQNQCELESWEQYDTRVNNTIDIMSHKGKESERLSQLRESVSFVNQKRISIEKGVWILADKRQVLCMILKVKQTDDND